MMKFPRVFHRFSVFQASQDDHVLLHISATDIQTKYTLNVHCIPVLYVINVQRITEPKSINPSYPTLSASDQLNIFLPRDALVHSAVVRLYVVRPSVRL